MSQRFRRVLGWLAVGVSTLLASFWAYWGIIEAFHEGWFYRSLWMNLGLTSAQYLSPMLAFMAACLVAIRWPRAGGGLHAAAGLGAAWFFRGAAPVVIYPFIVVPLGAMGAFYWFGRAEPRRWAAAVAAGVPLLVLIACGIEPVTRVAGRVDDGNREARRVEADGVDLLWAPEGPGWPREGVTWAEAASRCRHLSADGKSLADSPQGLWRLPTVEESVRSQHRHGISCSGTWNAGELQAAYQTLPDKEPPLWDPYSPVIYWWTATEVDESAALIIVYNGTVWKRPKQANWGYLGFRAVKGGCPANGTPSTEAKPQGGV